MNKLLLIVMMLAVWTYIGLQQIESELAMRTLFEGKRAVNRAAHAAAQQLDHVALAEGIFRIEEARAAEAAGDYLRINLKLDENGVPMNDAFLKRPVEVLVFELINAEHSFPYTYRNEDYHYEVTLQRPGVIMIIQLEYPRAFEVLEPIKWEIKGAAELIVG